MKKVILGALALTMTLSTPLMSADLGQVMYKGDGAPIGKGDWVVVEPGDNPTWVKLPDAPSLVPSVADQRILSGVLTIDMRGFGQEICQGKVTIDRGEEMETNLQMGRFIIEKLDRDEDWANDDLYSGNILIVDGKLTMNMEPDGFEDDPRPDNPRVVLYARNNDENVEAFYHGKVDDDNCSIQLTVHHDKRFH